LQKRGLLNSLRSNLVLGDSITQAAQFATTGNAIGGLLAYSLVLSPEFANRGSYVLLPDGDYPPLRQRMVLLKRAGPIANRFYEFVQSPDARAIFQQHGFDLPR
jgi:molybdate transport system substrate-binding protein